MAADDKDSAPTDLADAGRELWCSVTEQLHSDGLELDATERRVLHDACRVADDAERLAVALRSAPVVVTGSTGQEVPNRLFDEVRKSRALIAALLKQLDLADPEARRSGSGSKTTSSSARAAAQVRWAKPRGA